MGREPDTTVELDLTIKGETDKAWKVEDGRGTEAWLPKSQLSWPSNVKTGNTVSLDVPKWLADKSDLE
jgi:hypothetical protein